MQFKSCGRISERHKTPFNSWRCVALLVAYADAAREPSRSNKVTRVRRICINATARGRSRGHQRSMPRKVVSVKRDRQPFVHKKVDSPKKRATPRNKITRNISVFIGRFFFFSQVEEAEGKICQDSWQTNRSICLMCRPGTGWMKCNTAETRVRTRA